MRLGTNKALGIDISDGRISLALLKRGKNGVELLKVASGSVPEGAVRDGNIADAAALSRAIRELKTRNRIRAPQAAVSLLARPVLMQMIDMPKQLPANIGQFIKNEVKQCVFLSGKKIALDFCGISNFAKDAQTTAGRVFAVAADRRRVAEINETCHQAGLNLEAIEPGLLACARALYEKKIAGKFDCNVLMAVLEDNVLNLCVFRKQTADFVRTKNIGREMAEQGLSRRVADTAGKPPLVAGGAKLCQRLAEEINAIIQFYDVEVGDNYGKWEITVVANGGLLPQDAEELLRAKVAGACRDGSQTRRADSLHLRTPESAPQVTVVGRDSGSQAASAAAVGLAMKLLGTSESDLRINLLPPEASGVKCARKDTLVAANIGAVILLLMLLSVGVLGMMTKKVNENIAYIKRTRLSKDTHTLIEQQESIDRQISTLSRRTERMNEVLSSHCDIDWGRVLNDIGNGTPKTVRITELLSKGSSRMFVKGLALSYGAVDLFVGMLNESQAIDSASLIETEKDDGELVRYVISCSLARRREGTADVN